MSEIKINGAYQVSDHTAKLIECYNLANDLYTKLGDTLEEIYGDMQVDHALEPFANKWGDMRLEIERLICDSVRDNLNTGGDRTII